MRQYSVQPGKVNSNTLKCINIDCFRTGNVETIRRLIKSKEENLFNEVSLLLNLVKKA